MEKKQPLTALSDSECALVPTLQLMNEEDVFQGACAKSVFQVASLVSDATHLLLLGILVMFLLKSERHISSNV